MAKTKKETKVQKEAKQTFLTKFDINKIIPPKYHVLTLLLLIFHFIFNIS